MKIKGLSIENYLLVISYLLIFFFFIFQGAIYSPDTYSYINANIYRSPGYPIFTKFLQFVSGVYFDFVIVAIQLLISLIGIHVFFKIASKIFQLKWIEKLFLFVILIFPFFKPLLIANNISSEGLSYPLYLLFLSSVLYFFSQNTSRAFYFILTNLTILILTRGQFIILPLLILTSYILIFKKQIICKLHVKRIILLCLLPLAVLIMDKTYHLLKDGVFVSTPFTYLCVSGSAFYVSKSEDINFINSKDDKQIFEDCYTFINDNNWLLSSKKRNSYKDYYQHFHNNLGNICNYTLHDRGTKFYVDKGYSIVEARIAIENTCKDIAPILIKNNFKEWIRLYYSNLIHSFKSPFILFFIMITLIFSGFKIITTSDFRYSYLFLFSSLILSNAVIVVFASHSIMRYLFYNFALFYLIFLILIRLTKHEKQT
ncbi:hypothetical protein [Hanstruepera marina]|uniref:hypothetical protein n=1 Tax=Hanstruepera marina TaxID=2873265 RepID=UPI001CA678C7|nr:hypothetical protein [Hanstruepera marina]